MIQECDSKNLERNAPDRLVCPVQQPTHFKAAVQNHTTIIALYCAERGFSIYCDSLHFGTIRIPTRERLLIETRQGLIYEISSESSRIVPVSQKKLLQSQYCLPQLNHLTWLGELIIDGEMIAGSEAMPINGSDRKCFTKEVYSDTLEIKQLRLLDWTDWKKYLLQLTPSQAEGLGYLKI